VVYWPVKNHKFIKYDDDKYITDNRNVQSGLNPESIRWAFTTGHASNWHPVTWMSHMLDCQIFDLNAGAHHLVNVFFHIINTLLLFIVLKRMTKELWLSAFVAALFGLHPLHIESVAWAAERKDVLSTFFWMLTMWAYVRYAERPKVTRYLLAILFFVVGLMAKPMLVTLPFILLLLDYWPLERMQFGKLIQEENQGNSIQRKSFLNLLIEKIPFIFFSIVSCVVTFIVQRRTGAVQTIDAIDIKSRAGNAVISYIGYISKMIWPDDLAILYPHPGDSLSMNKVAVCGLLLIFLSFCFMFLARRHKYLVVGWLWYIGTLIPVIGLVQVGVQAMADRYTYIPLTGLFIIIAWGVSDLFKSQPYRKYIFVFCAVIILSAITIKTSLQLKYWHDSVTLFQHTIAVTQNNYVMHNNYGNYLMNMGKLDEAVEHFNKSLKIKPRAAKVHNNLGNALSRLEKLDDAIEHYKTAISLESDFSDAHYNLAIVLSKQNKTDEAIKEYRESLHLDPGNVDALSNLGFELAQQGNSNEAIELYNKALAIEPENVITHGRLGLALASAGKIDEAIQEFRIVLKARPDDAEMWCNLGILLERQGKTAEAIEQYRRALQIDPDFEKARKLLEKTLEKENNPQ
jgi:tetratricopeptide (TPR) repeat protein